MTTPVTLRAAYLLASGDLATAERQISDLRMALKDLEKRAETCREIKEAFRNAACGSCLGQGFIQHFYAQDDVKAERCETCGGTGLPK